MKSSNEAEENREQSTSKIKPLPCTWLRRKATQTPVLKRLPIQRALPKGAVYYHFKSKSASSSKFWMILNCAPLNSSRTGTVQADGSAKDLLIRFVNFQADWAAKHPDDIGVLIMMSIGFTHLIRTYIEN